MRRLARSGLLTMLAGLSSCAPRHDEIMPAFVPPFAFETANCRQLGLMHAKATRSLVYAELAQDQQYADDRTRTFGIPTPMTSIFESSHAAEVARLKGETLALAAEIDRKRCVAFEG